MRSPIRARRLVWARRRSDNPDVTILQEELDASERRLRESHRVIEQLRADLEDRAAEVRALRRVGEATGSAMDLEEVLKVAADIAIQTTGTDSCQIYLYDKQKDELVLRAADESAQSMIGKIRLKLGEGITGWVARERKHVAVVNNATKDHRFKYFPEIHEEQYESMLSVPLVDKGKMVGVINVRTRRPHEYTRTQMRLLSGIASQISGAIETTRRRRHLEKTAVQVHTLSEVSQAIASNIYTDEVLHLFVEMTARALGYKICTVMLVNPDSRELEIKATQSESQEYNRKPHLKLGESIAGRAALEGQVLVIPDVRKNSEYRFPDVARVAGLCSLCSVPLWSKGKVVGVLNCYTEKAHTFTKEEIAILQALAAQAALAIENAKLMVRSAVIQEMHHRVKNNLQQIASLVRLQQHFSNYITVGDALSDTLNRILAIAAVHELLSRDDLDTVSVNKVADQILSAAKQSVVAPGKTVYTEIAGPEVRLPLSQATSVALVINELVHNAIEHGFGDLDEGRIRIETDCTDREATIVVQNDGKPLPDGFDPAESNSLGLKIVTDLVRGGLGGSFQMENRDRITATVRFPLASAANRP